MSTTLERGLSRASMSVSSPRLSVHRDVTPPAVSDPALLHIHDRINQLDSRILDLHSTVLTKDGYVDRRNREDEYIRREFENHYSISSRIDFNVSLLRTDVEQLKTGISQLEARIGQLGTDTAFLRSDIDRLRKDVDDVQTKIEQLQTDVSGCRIEISKLQAAVSQIRTDLMTLQHETSQQSSTVLNRFSMMERRMTTMEGRMTTMDARMKHMERIRFNSLARTIHAPITPVPMVQEDGSLRYPEYFPKTVWRFWCLKKKSRLHRLAELAEFYQLEGYQYWGAHDDFAPSDSDSSDSNDYPPNLTRAEAARLYPEACHQALAATLGLVYYKIRKAVGEGPNSHLALRPPKRLQEEVASSTSSKQKPAKVARLPSNAPPATLHKFVTRPSPEAKSQASEEMDKIGWNTHVSEISDETESKIRGIVTNELSAILRAVERRRVKLKPSRSERGNMSPTESKHSVRNGENQADAANRRYRTRCRPSLSLL